MKQESLRHRPNRLAVGLVGLVACSSILSGCTIKIGANSPKGKFMSLYGGNNDMLLGPALTKGCLDKSDYNYIYDSVSKVNGEIEVESSDGIVPLPPLVFVTRSDNLVPANNYTESVLKKSGCDS